MSTQIGICLMLVVISYLIVVNAVPAPSTSMERQDQKQSSAAFFERFGVDDVDKEMLLHSKRVLNKKWARFFQGSQLPYTVAFPALIRNSVTS